MHAPLFFRLRAFLLLLCLVAVGSVAAQPAPAPASAPIRARLFFLSVNNSAFEDLRFLSDKAEVPVEAPTEFVSQPHEYVGPARFTLLRKRSGPPAPVVPGQPPPPAFEPVAYVDLPPTGGEFLLVLGQAGERIQIRSVDFSAQSVPENGYLFWNLTARPLAVTLGASRALVGAGQRAMLRPPEDADYMPLRVFDDASGAARQVFASRHLHRPAARQLVFLTEGASPERIRLRMVTQQVAVIRPVVPPAAGTR